jgi:predicted metalloprotease with PDZ domain
MRVNKLLSLGIISCLILSGCGPGKFLGPTLASSPTLKPTLTPTNHPTTTQTNTQTPTPDLTTLGNPPQKSYYVYPDWLPQDYFSYDEQNFFIYKKNLHGTDVIISVSKQNPQEEYYHQQFAEFVWNTFQLYWEVFQGYPYKSFIVKVLAPNSGQRFISATSIGFLILTNPQITNMNNNWYVDSFNFKQIVTHEMFHAWNGEIIMCNPCHAAYIQSEAWFFEGGTQYYGYRGTPEDIALYNRRIGDSWQRYQDALGTKYDIPIVDMSEMDYTTGDGYYGQMMREKGACLFYLLDKELLSMGMSLDKLMQYMYEKYGLTWNRYSTSDILIGLNSITSSDWTEFFNKYIYGTEELPLDGDLDYLNH